MKQVKNNWNKKVNAVLTYEFGFKKVLKKNKNIGFWESCSKIK